MTVNTTTITSGPYSGNDVTTAFNYNFRIDVNTQLKVFETDDNGTTIELTLTTDYTVSGVGDDTGGQVTRVAGALPTNYTWYIRSDYDSLQETDFESQGGFFPDIHESAFDKVTFQVQQLIDLIDRGIRFDESVSDIGVLTISGDAATRANQVVAFNTTGDDIELQPGVGNFRGDWTTVTNYAKRDVIIDAAGAVGLNNIYICNTAHLSDDLAVDITNWDLMIDMTLVTASEAAALASQIAAAASAAAALVSEGNADTSETNAAASAAAALVSEGNAATSETNAAAFAAAALVSENNAAIGSTVSFNNISGLVPSNAADADHDITISTGRAFDSTETKLLELTSTLTKQIDAAWAAGDNLGGLFSGTVAADTTYHLFIIEKDLDGSIDAGFDDNVLATNIPAGYTAYRRVASFLTDGSANLLEFSAIETAGGGYRLTYKDIQKDLDTTAQTTAEVSLKLTIPQGLFRPLGHLKATLNNTSSATIVITEATQTDVDPVGVEDLRVNNTFSAGNMDRVVNNFARVNYRSSSGSNSGFFRIFTLGYTDFRR